MIGHHHRDVMPLVPIASQPGHAILGCQQRLRGAVNDHMGIEPVE
jgi:hypothetical protein